MANLEINFKRSENDFSTFPGGTIFTIGEKAYITLSDCYQLHESFTDTYFPVNAIGLEKGNPVYITDGAQVVKAKSAKLEIET